MRISREQLAAEAETTGFREDTLEKAAHLLEVLDAVHSHPFLKGKLVLKGGTALNLFVFDVPRLSVDIDLNYVGAESRDAMLEERTNIEKAIQSVFARGDYRVRRMPEAHAGGKWSLRYPTASGHSGRIDVDINYMYRIPLWPVMTLDSHPLGVWQARNVPVMDIHELASGKLCALLSRHRARDLFDSHQILSMDDLDIKRLRLAFVVYGAMNRRDWREVSVLDVDFDPVELSSQLLPSLRSKAAENLDTADYGEMLVDECRKLLSELLSFNDSERAFLDLLLDEGEVAPTLLTSDRDIQQRIQSQPLLEWKALNVRRHRGASR